MKLKSELLLLYNNYNIKYSITFDAWIANNQKEYLDITIHYINENWILNSRIIDMEILKEKHSASYLLEKIWIVLNEFDIRQKIMT